MTPALVAVGTYALLLAWNEYLYQFPLLSSKQTMTLPVALAQFLNSDESPCNYIMATTFVYALPPIAIYYVFRRCMTAGLASVASKAEALESEVPPDPRDRRQMTSSKTGPRRHIAAPRDIGR
jgi:multiple sugar transport system permease protein